MDAGMTEPKEVEIWDFGAKQASEDCCRDFRQS